MAGEWIEWAGGDCPVPEGIEVDVKFQNGEVCDNGMVPSTSWDWAHGDCGGYDIVAYRIVTP